MVSKTDCGSIAVLNDYVKNLTIQGTDNGQP
jgi:hypothetical protein